MAPIDIVLYNTWINRTQPTTIRASRYSNVTSYNEVPVAFKAVQVFFLASFILVGVIGNVCVCTFITRCRELRATTNAFYFSLAIANIGVAVICIPFTLSSIFTGKWTLGADLCYINGIANPFWITASCYSVTATTIHKFFSVTRPMKQLITRRTVFMMVSAVWLASCVVCIWPILQDKQIIYKPVAGHCGYSISGRRNEFYYLIFLVCAVLICPTVINTYCYARIFRVLSVHRLRIRRSTVIDEIGAQHHRRNIVTFYVVFVIFFITWLPFNVYSIFFVVGSDELVPDWFLAVAYICAYSTCAQIPVIIVYRSPKLKCEFKRLMRKLFPCCDSGNGSRPELFNRDSEAVETELEKRNSAWFVSSWPVRNGEIKENESEFTVSNAYEHRIYDESKL